MKQKEGTGWGGERMSDKEGEWENEGEGRMREREMGK